MIAFNLTFFGGEREKVIYQSLLCVFDLLIIPHFYIAIVSLIPLSSLNRIEFTGFD